VANPQDVVSAMTYTTVACGDTIIRQGDAGDNFYCVDYGEYDVMVGTTKVAEAVNGGSFGELALMYGSPRAATVTARTDGGLWALDRAAFRCAFPSWMSEREGGGS
jgi:cAMP-dependent protein kinase regulator